MTKDVFWSNFKCNKNDLNHLKIVPKHALHFQKLCVGWRVKKGNFFTFHRAICTKKIVLII